jgi:hypothetical protein
VMKKIKLIFLATVCVISIGSAPAYAINNICVTIHNNLNHGVDVYGYDTNDGVMWAPLSPGVSNVGRNSTLKLCFDSLYKKVKVRYKSEQSQGSLGSLKNGDSAFVGK